MSEPSPLSVTDLVSLARAQAVDTDHLLDHLNHASLVLLNLKPQTYPSELHRSAERICVLQGEAGIDYQAGTVRLKCGESLVVPPGQLHAFSADSDAVVLAILGNPA